MITNLLLVGVGGFIGATARYGLSLWIKTFVEHPFPVATFTINILGCFVMGLIVQFMRESQVFPTVSLFLGVGVLGSFTTFSAFGFDTIELLRAQEFRLALLYAVGSVVTCLLALYLGSWTSRLLS